MTAFFGLLGPWIYTLSSSSNLGKGIMVLSNDRSMPTDIFHSVLEHITDRRDLYAAALANWDWNRAATPLLYRTLDTDTRARQRDHKSVCDICPSQASYSPPRRRKAM